MPYFVFSGSRVGLRWGRLWGLIGVMCVIWLGSSTSWASPGRIYVSLTASAQVSRRPTLLYFVKLLRLRGFVVHRAQSVPKKRRLHIQLRWSASDVLTASRALFAVKDAMQRNGALASAETLLRAIAAKGLSAPITEQALYDAGVLSYRRHRKRESAQTFRHFLRRFPRSKNAKMARWYLQQLTQTVPPPK